MGKIPTVVTTSDFEQMVNQTARVTYGERGLLNRTSLMKSLLPIMLEVGDAVELPQGKPCRMVAILRDAVDAWVLYLVRRRRLIASKTWSRIRKYRVADFELLSTISDAEFDRLLTIPMDFSEIPTDPLSL